MNEDWIILILLYYIDILGILIFESLFLGTRLIGFDLKNLF